jgi:hypothetical protein
MVFHLARLLVCWPIGPIRGRLMDPIRGRRTGKIGRLERPGAAMCASVTSADQRIIYDAIALRCLLNPRRRHQFRWQIPKTVVVLICCETVRCRFLSARCVKNGAILNTIVRLVVLGQSCRVSRVSP